MMSTGRHPASAPTAAMDDDGDEVTARRREENSPSDVDNVSLSLGP